MFWPVGLQSAATDDSEDQVRVSSVNGGKSVKEWRYRHNPEPEYDEHVRDWYYGRQSSDDGGDQYYRQRRDWPECFGSCYAGRCKVNQAAPGCCYPDGEGFYSSSHQTDVAVASSGYKQNGLGRDLVCWKSENGPAQIVQDQG